MKHHAAAAAALLLTVANGGGDTDHLQMEQWRSVPWQTARAAAGFDGTSILAQPRGPSCWANASARTYSIFVPHPNAPSSLKKAIRQQPRVDKFAGDCYAHDDHTGRRGSSRIDNATCCCAYWPTEGNARIAPSIRDAAAMGGNACSASFHDPVISRRRRDPPPRAGGGGESQPPRCRVAVTLSGAVERCT